jgi:CheY-like chemotaxis protein
MDSANRLSSVHASAGYPVFVVMADDSAVARALHARLLLMCHCSTLCFRDASDLMEDFWTFVGVGGQRNMYADVILLDYDMPKMSGGEATAELRKNGYEGSIVVLTSNIDAQAACVAAGATSVHTKPLTLAALKILLHDLPKSCCTEVPRALQMASTTSASQQTFALAARGSRSGPDKADASAGASNADSAVKLPAIRAQLGRDGRRTNTRARCSQTRRK